MRNCAAGREDIPHCLRLNLRWEIFFILETVAAQWIRVCGPAQYGLKAARRAPQFSKRLIWIIFNIYCLQNPENNRFPGFSYISCFDTLCRFLLDSTLF